MLAKAWQGGDAIPDAERRLPHWSDYDEAGNPLRYKYSRRRKASASLELGYRKVDEVVGQDSRRRKASASLELRTSHVR